MFFRFVLEVYARQKLVYVAVVSADQDSELASDRFNSLLHFHSLSTLTELLLSDDSRVEQYRSVIEEKMSEVEAAILEELPRVSQVYANAELGSKLGSTNAQNG